jgi:2-polyprenyl-3-methyl-5-hydroxy-6-metoxy-1,4-benzoquinol methylase
MDEGGKDNQFISGYNQILDDLRRYYLFKSGLNPISLSETKLGLLNSTGVLTQIAPNPSIMDYGADNGVLGVMLADRLHASSLVQVDTSDSRARTSALLEIPFVKVERNQAPDLQGRFDLIFVSDVVHFVPNEKRLELVTKLADNLKSAGRLIIFEYNPQYRGAMAEFKSTLEVAKENNPDLGKVIMVIAQEESFGGSDPSSTPGFRITRKYCISC